MKADATDILIRLAFVEGKIRTHGAFEEAARKRTSRVKASKASRLALLERLEGALPGASNAADVPLTVGVFLRSLRSGKALTSPEIFKRLGITRNIYRMLEHDRISPLKIAPEVWLRFRRLFQLQAESLAGMVQRTHQLVFFRPAFRSTLARYDGKAKRSAKSRALEQAAAELYTRADLELPPEETGKLEALLRIIRKQA